VKTLEWKKPLEIIKYPDPRLRQVNAKITVFDGALLELAKEMINIMYE
jgi:peptide deformylase